MKLFLSGSTSTPSLPERVLGHLKPDLMLTAWDLIERKGNTKRRIERLIKRRLGTGGTSKDCPQESIGIHFLDSGAHSLYTEYSINRSGSEKGKFYKTKAFKRYLKRYAELLEKYKTGIDLYVNVDVIFNPELSYQNQKILENEFGLNPVPVVHYGTELKWLDKYIHEGYDMIGLGGLGQEVTSYQYFQWADRVYSHICKNAQRNPCVKTHGFAMTSYELLLRYPWFSVDSASWTKAAAYGMVYVPHKRNGVFVFDEKPYSICASLKSPMRGVAGRHILSLSRAEQTIFRDWLAQVNVLYGSIDDKGNEVERGVITHHDPRKVVNLHFFEALRASIPEWPWPFKLKPRRGFFNI